MGFSVSCCHDSQPRALVWRSHVATISMLQRAAVPLSSALERSFWIFLRSTNKGTFFNLTGSCCVDALFDCFSFSSLGFTIITAFSQPLTCCVGDHAMRWRPPHDRWRADRLPDASPAFDGVGDMDAKGTCQDTGRVLGFGDLVVTTHNLSL